MGRITIDGIILKKAIIAGANELSAKRNYVDSLNVFPVPDGDTGINMSLTVLAAAKEVDKLNTPNVYDIAKAASNGSLRGARGNSGVILSQLFRGFAKGLEGKSVANAEDLADAFMKGMETAYKAVMKPKEGTILTVARAIGEHAVEAAFDTEDIGVMLESIIEYAHSVLKETQQMLPELKQAGVVDAGGMGLLYILEGGYASRNVEGDIQVIDPAAKEETAQPAQAAINPADIKFGYCTEFFINVAPVTEEMETNLRNYLNTMGDSIVVVGDEDIIKVHVHTNHPGTVIERAISMGPLSNLKIDNMREQHNHLINFSEQADAPSKEEQPAEQEKKDLGFITVSTGDGLKALFESLGADVIIEGGQSMNPSTEDFLGAIDKVNSDNIIILPNNKNIVLAAEQAAKLTNKNVKVVKSTTIPQGISALINNTIGAGIDENVEVLEEAIASISTGQITYAVRDSKFEDQDITDGDILCMLEGKIKCVAKEIEAGAKELIDKMFEARDGDFMSIYYGENITQEDAQNLADYINEKYPDCETEVVEGGQPLYYYIISLE